MTLRINEADAWSLEFLGLGKGPLREKRFSFFFPLMDICFPYRSHFLPYFFILIFRYIERKLIFISDSEFFSKMKWISSLIYNNFLRWISSLKYNNSLGLFKKRGVSILNLKNQFNRIDSLINSFAFNGFMLEIFQYVIQHLMKRKLSCFYSEQEWNREILWFIVRSIYIKIFTF